MFALLMNTLFVGSGIAYFVIILYCEIMRRVINRRKKGVPNLVKIFYHKISTLQLIKYDVPGTPLLFPDF